MYFKHKCNKHCKIKMFMLGEMSAHRRKSKTLKSNQQCVCPKPSHQCAHNSSSGRISRPMCDVPNSEPCGVDQIATLLPKLPKTISLLVGNASSFFIRQLIPLPHSFGTSMLSKAKKPSLTHCDLRTASRLLVVQIHSAVPRQRPSYIESSQASAPPTKTQLRSQNVHVSGVWFVPDGFTSKLPALAPP